MTEREWLACDDPVELLLPPQIDKDRSRRYALFAYAASQYIWANLDEYARRIVVVAERNEYRWHAWDELAVFEQRLRREEVLMLTLRELQRQAANSQASRLVRDILKQRPIPT